jgi:endonuclease-3 related protein
MEMYDRLFEAFGPQHWWPGRTRFEIVVGAVLTQNTNWLNVERAIENLKKQGRLSLDGILKCKELPKLIRPSGYYNVKARRLRALCEHIQEQGGLEAMFDLPIDELREGLLSVKGIGEETADSIVLYAAEKPVFVVDAYTRRVLARIGLIEGNEAYAHVQRLFMDSIPKDVQLYNEYHALLVKLGKAACKKREPDCASCPLNNLCDYAKGK